MNLSIAVGLAIWTKVIKCILSFSASSKRVLIHPLSSSIFLNDFKWISIPATIPGTAATVSRTTALWPYLFLKKVSAKNRKNFVKDKATLSLKFLGLKCLFNLLIYYYLNTTYKITMCQICLIWVLFFLNQYLCLKYVSKSQSCRLFLNFLYIITS